MRLATCSFHQFRSPMGIPVPITLALPKFPLPWEVPSSLRILAPDYGWFDAPDEEFNRRYFAKLDRYGVGVIRAALHRRMDGDDPLVLLCYENLGKPGSACHRELFAMWWAKYTGVKVPELGRYYVPRSLDMRRAKASLNGPLPIQGTIF